MSKKLFPVTLQYLFRYKGPLPFDVYIERYPDKFSRIHIQHEMYDPEQVSHFEAKVGELLVDQAQLPEFNSFLSSTLERSLISSEDLDPTEVNEIMALSLELTYQAILDQTDELNENLKNSNLYVKSCLKILNSDLRNGIDLYLAIAQDASLLKHSFHVMLLTLAIAQKSGYTTEKILAPIGVGAFLHDIGHSRIDQEIFIKQRLTPKEWDAIKDHPHLGLKMVDQLKGLSHEIRSIILQHHEYCNGRGYPNRLTQAQIFPPARLVAVADVFSSLTVRTNYRSVIYSPGEAIEIMKSDIGHFDPDHLNSLQQVFMKSKNKLAS
jgi:putative nucleotidyltransferase with HDIG domain